MRERGRAVYRDKGSRVWLPYGLKAQGNACRHYVVIGCDHGREEEEEEDRPSGADRRRRRCS